MCRGMKILTGVCIALIVLCSNGFCEYYQLVGKWVTVNGPSDWKLLGVALDEATCERLIAAHQYNDTLAFEALLKDYDIFRIKNHSSALVLEVKLFEQKAKVMVFDGWYKRESGWIPITWLEGNEERPRIKDVEPRLVSKK